MSQTKTEYHIELERIWHKAEEGIISAIQKEDEANQNRIKALQEYRSKKNKENQTAFREALFTWLDAKLFTESKRVDEQKARVILMDEIKILE